MIQKLNGDNESESQVESSKTVDSNVDRKRKGKLIQKLKGENKVDSIVEWSKKDDSKR